MIFNIECNLVKGSIVSSMCRFLLVTFQELRRFVEDILIGRIVELQYLINLQLPIIGYFKSIMV